MEIKSRQQLPALLEKIQQQHTNDPENLASLRQTLDKILDSPNSMAIDYCINRYVLSEIDFETTGERGLGRVSVVVPRLGAYFRNQISLLTENQRNELATLLAGLMLSGYFVHSLIIKELEKPRKLNENELFEKWIPGIYSTNPSDLPREVLQGFSLISEGTYKELKGFFARHKMKRGSFFSKDKTDFITAYYPVAGYGLRYVEANPYA